VRRKGEGERGKRKRGSREGGGRGPSNRDRAVERKKQQIGKPENSKGGEGRADQYKH
jgi:hypothetical protein